MQKITGQTGRYGYRVFGGDGWQFILRTAARASSHREQTGLRRRWHPWRRHFRVAVKVQIDPDICRRIQIEFLRHQPSHAHCCRPMDAVQAVAGHVVPNAGSIGRHLIARRCWASPPAGPRWTD